MNKTKHPKIEGSLYLVYAPGWCPSEYCVCRYSGKKFVCECGAHTIISEVVSYFLIDSKINSLLGI